MAGYLFSRAGAHYRRKRLRVKHCPSRDRVAHAATGGQAYARSCGWIEHPLVGLLRHDVWHHRTAKVISAKLVMRCTYAQHVHPSS